MISKDNQPELLAEELKEGRIEGALEWLKRTREEKAARAALTAPDHGE